MSAQSVQPSVVRSLVLNWCIWPLNLLALGLFYHEGILLPFLIVGVLIILPMLALSRREGRKGVQLLIRRIIGVPVFLALLLPICFGFYRLAEVRNLQGVLTCLFFVGFFLPQACLIWRILLFPRNPPPDRRWRRFGDAPIMPGPLPHQSLPLVRSVSLQTNRDNGAAVLRGLDGPQVEFERPQAGLDS